MNKYNTRGSFEQEAKADADDEHNAGDFSVPDGFRSRLRLTLNTPRQSRRPANTRVKCPHCRSRRTTVLRDYGAGTYICSSCKELFIKVG